MLTRFLSPKSIAVYGGGWAENVIEQLQKSGYTGDIWPVHPSRKEVLGVVCYSETSALPTAPDAAFVGVNREQTVKIVAELAEINSGGAICFASGFRESDQLIRNSADDLQSQLVEAAGDMPLLGPNCYGFINYLDNVCIWPDQHGGKLVEEGAAIIAQSSNIAINMTMQRRGLALSHMITVGNQAKVGVSELAHSLIADPRVKAIGLYLEGFGDIPAFENMVTAAKQANKPVVVLKIGKSVKAQAAALTHTATLAGGAVASSAFLKRLGIVEVDSVAVFLETLKMLQRVGYLDGNAISSVSCSGGEASLMADLSEASAIRYPELSDAQQQSLHEILGPKVELANPLDYHTYVWGDVPRMRDCFATVMCGAFDLNVFVLDIPRRDICDPIGHDCAVEAIIAAKSTTDAKVAVLALLPENLDEIVTRKFHQAGIVCLHGMVSGIAAIDAVIRAGELVQQFDTDQAVIVKPGSEPASVLDKKIQTLDEYTAKAILAKHNVPIPHSKRFSDKPSILGTNSKLNYPLVLKGLGVAHKTESNAVVINIESETELVNAVQHIVECPDGYILEEMVSDVVAELIVGITFDATGLALLTIGAGGIYTEVLQDSVTLLLPSSRQSIDAAISSLRINTVLNGYRGKPAVDRNAMLDAIEAVCDYAQAHVDTLIELDVNPLLLGPETAVAVDALIRVSN